MICLFLILFSLGKFIEPNPKVALDIQIGSQANPIRIELELDASVVPKTVKNFVELCKGFEKDGKVLGYKGSIFHRIIP